MRRVASAGALFLALAIFHTWPLSQSPAHQSLNYNADAQLNAWIISWAAHALPTRPQHLFDGNIFAPEQQTLTYSDPLIAPAMLGAPIRWLGGSPVLTFNLLLIAGLTLTAMAAWTLAWHWTGSAGASLVAGALAVFNVHLLTRLPHLQAAHAWGLPLVWFFADRLGRRPVVRDVIALAAIVAATAATSMYWLVFACAIAGVVAIVSGRARGALAIAGATTAGLVLALPVLLPYLRFAAAGATRPLSLVAQFSATPAGYLVSTSRIYLQSAWNASLRTTDVNMFFPGIVALGLAAIGVASAWSNGTTGRRRLIAIGAIGVLGVVLSFGPSTSLYQWLYHALPPLRGLRAAARFGYLFLLAVAFAAAVGVAAIERRLRSPRAKATLAGVALVLVTAEAWQGPVPTVPFTRVPAIYSLLRDVPTPVRLVEVPFYLPDAVFENGEYVLNATAHWQPVMNGYSGFTPDSYRQRAETLWLFPAEFAMQTIHDAGATHVMVHLERFGADARAVEQAIAARADFRLIATDRTGHRLYEVTH